MPLLCCFSVIVPVHAVVLMCFSAIPAKQQQDMIIKMRRSSLLFVMLLCGMSVWAEKMASLRWSKDDTEPSESRLLSSSSAPSPPPTENPTRVLHQWRVRTSKQKRLRDKFQIGSPSLSSTLTVSPSPTFTLTEVPSHQPTDGQVLSMSSPSSVTSAPADSSAGRLTSCSK